STVILIFRKDRVEKRLEDVLFIDASHEFSPENGLNRLRDQGIDRIESALLGFRSVDGFAYRATLDEIKNNHFNLNLGRYIGTSEIEDDVDLGESLLQLDHLERELAAVHAQM